MSHRKDVERSPKNTERTPLLEESRQNDDDQASDATLQDGQRSPRDEHEEAALLEPQPRPQRTKSWYIWRAFWFILVVLVLALFIKGWVDSDDTNVSSARGYLYAFVIS